MVIPDNEMIANCDFCGTSVTKSRIEYTEFPQGIIPFYITRDEAVRIAIAWARKNWSSQDIQYKLPQISKNLQQKSSHGFLKREYSGQLRREFREFPQYRPQHPLFYKMLPDFKGEMHEKVGVYKMNILNKSLKAAKFAAFIAMHIYLFYIITLMSGDSSIHDFFSGVITVVSWCCGLFVLFFLLMLPEWLADPDFETVVPKYGNGGYQGDDETYYSEKRRRREIVTYSIVVVVFIVVVALLVSWVMKTFV